MKAIKKIHTYVDPDNVETIWVEVFSSSDLLCEESVQDLKDIEKV